MATGLRAAGPGDRAPMHRRVEGGYTSCLSTGMGKRSRDSDDDQLLKQRRAKARKIVRLLRRAYGEPVFERGDPLEQVVRTVLSHQTTSESCRAAWEALRSASRDWDQVRRMPEARLARIIRPAGIATIKARRIKQILSRVEEDFGAYDLSDLAEWNEREAEEYLMSLPGVGQKTARCVLLFALGHDALPVDTHVARVTRRLGLRDENAPAKDDHTELDKVVRAGDRGAMHVHLFRHGREVCLARRPRCGECSLADLCYSADKTV